MASRRADPPGARRGAMRGHRASRATPRGAAAGHPFGTVPIGPGVRRPPRP